MVFLYSSIFLSALTSTLSESEECRCYETLHFAADFQSKTQKPTLCLPRTLSVLNVACVSVRLEDLWQFAPLIWKKSQHSLHIHLSTTALYKHNLIHTGHCTELWNTQHMFGNPQWAEDHWVTVQCLNLAAITWTRWKIIAWIRHLIQIVQIYSVDLTKNIHKCKWKNKTLKVWKGTSSHRDRFDRAVMRAAWSVKDKQKLLLSCIRATSGQLSAAAVHTVMS